MCLISIKPFIVHTIYVSHCSNFYNVYNYNKNSLFDIFLTQLFAILLTTEIFKPRLFCSHTTSHKADCVLTDSQFALSYPFIVQHSLTNVLAKVKKVVRILVFSRTLHFCLFVYCVHIDACAPCTRLAVYNPLRTTNFLRNFSWQF